MNGIEIISQRLWGEPKLEKPKALKGVKPYESILFFQSLCPVFFSDKKMWVKHRDFLSSHISFETAMQHGIIQGWNKKFCYNDNYAGCILRGEAWITVSYDLLQFASECNFLLPWYPLLRALAHTLGIEEDGLWDHSWISFFENLITLYSKYRKEVRCD